MARIDLKHIVKSFGKTEVLKGIDLTVADGEFVVLVGPSGCGKSTLLRTLAGLETPTSGTIHIGERNVTHLPPKDRELGMVFQSYALYPHLSVRDNLSFGLKLRRASEDHIRKRVDAVAKMLGLEPLLDRRPGQLSGGQRQRVAMGRAIAREPRVFLFDEPLSNLDAALRTEVRVEIKRLHAELGATMVYVTHDQVEAMTLADRLVVLNAGVVEQAGPPLELYNTPATRFVAGFIGSPAMNFVTAAVAAGQADFEGATWPLSHVDGRIDAGFRPHDVELVGADDEGAFSVEVDVVEAMGFESFAHVATDKGISLVIRVDAERALARGDRLHIKPTRWHSFDADTGQRIP